MPHLSIARDDRTADIEYLTNLSMEEYDTTWKQFDSDFWKFKRKIFGHKQKKFCYAGAWSAYIDLTNGETWACYFKPSLGNAFENPELPFPEKPIGKCPLAHCYNGHALLTMGLIPDLYQTKYGDIRDRECADGSHWLQPELKEFFNSKLVDSNKKYSSFKKSIYYLKWFIKKIIYKPHQMIKKLFKHICNRAF